MNPPILPHSRLSNLRRTALLVSLACSALGLGCAGTSEFSPRFPTSREPSDRISDPLLKQLRVGVRIVKPDLSHRCASVAGTSERCLVAGFEEALKRRGVDVLENMGFRVVDQQPELVVKVQPVLTSERLLLRISYLPGTVENDTDASPRSSGFWLGDDQCFHGPLGLNVGGIAPSGELNDDVFKNDLKCQMTSPIVRSFAAHLHDGRPGWVFVKFAGMQGGVGAVVGADQRGWNFEVVGETDSKIPQNLDGVSERGDNPNRYDGAIPEKPGWGTFVSCRPHLRRPADGHFGTESLRIDFTGGAGRLDVFLPSGRNIGNANACWRGEAHTAVVPPELFEHCAATPELAAAKPYVIRVASTQVPEAETTRTVALSSDPPGAAVFRDQTFVGKTPIPLPLVDKTCQKATADVRFELTGFQTVERKVGDTATVVHVVMQPLSAAGR